MRSRSPHLSVLRSVVAIALGCSLVAGSTWSTSASSGGAIPAGGLSISTEPADAAVYVDGRPVGASPVQIAAVPAGEHRVRIVKSGYLENARVITVVAGEPRNLHVRLTPSGTPSPAAEQVVSGGGGGGSKKWLYIAAAGGAAVAAGVLLAGKNHAPTPGTASVSTTGTGIAAVTNFAFAAQGSSDPDSDPLTLTWSFGDGGSATGSNVNHVFANAGTFNVSVTVSDGKAEAKTPDIPVTVRNVSATWVSNLQGIVRTWTLTQAGASASGSYSRNDAGVVTPGTVTATMTSQRSISGTASSTGFTPFTFEGTFDSGVGTLTIVANGSGFNNAMLTFTRQ